MCAGSHLPGEEGAVRVPEEQTLPHQAEDPGVRQSDGLERRLQLITSTVGNRNRTGEERKKINTVHISNGERHWFRCFGIPPNHIESREFALLMFLIRCHFGLEHNMYRSCVHILLVRLCHGGLQLVPVGNRRSSICTTIRTPPSYTESTVLISHLITKRFIM